MESQTRAKATLRLWSEKVGRASNIFLKGVGFGALGFRGLGFRV